MGNGPSASLGKCRRIDRSIAHNDGAAGVKFAAVAARRRVFPGIDARPTRKFTPLRKVTFRAAKHQNGSSLEAYSKDARGPEEHERHGVGALPAMKKAAIPAAFPRSSVRRA